MFHTRGIKINSTPLIIVSLYIEVYLTLIIFKLKGYKIFNVLNNLTLILHKLNKRVHGMYTR